jgi:hypothetical protein
MAMHKPAIRKRFLVKQAHLPLILAAIFFAVSGSLRAEAYHGFQVDYSQVQTNEKLPRIKAALERQVNMVTNVGLPEGILDFFKGVPVVVVAGRQSFGGRYLPKLKRIEMAENFLLRGRKPALLHEFLHSYHNQKLPDGIKNSKVIESYREAGRLNAYDPKSHMMDNAKEYFASVGTAYLFGVTELEPFTREKVQKCQPDFYQFLKDLFGPKTGDYKGSLTEHTDVLKEEAIKASEQNGK